jgi:hypothetical protein
MLRNKTNLFRLAAAACLTIGSMNAAEKISYEEFRGLARNLDHRSIKIRTADGKNHKGRTVVMGPDHVRLFHFDQQWEDIPGDEIVGLEIGQGGRFSHHIGQSAQIPSDFAELVCWGSDVCIVSVTLVLSPIWAYSLATAPFFLAADGIAFLIPPKVYEITH